MNRISLKSRYQGLKNFPIMYDFNFDPIIAYLEDTQEMIIQQEKEIAKKYDKRNEKYRHNPEAPDGFERYEEEIINNSKFSNILNQSVYLSIYSIFENDFFYLCEYCRKVENIKIGPKDLKKEGGYIGQCKNFITKVLDVNRDDLGDKWIEIKKYQLIRNSIAHNNGIIKSPTQDILNFIRESNGISIDEKNFIIIDSIEFSKNLIDKLTEFLSSIIDEIIKQKDKQTI